MATTTTDGERMVRVLGVFTERNAGRRVRLEEDDASFGTQVAEDDRPLRGVSYDPRDGRVQIMFGGYGSGTDHLTHTVQASSVDVLTGPDGRDQVLRIAHRGGQARLRILD